MQKRKTYLILMHISPLPRSLLPILHHGALELLIAEFVFEVAQLAIVFRTVVPAAAVAAAIVMVVVMGSRGVRATIVHLDDRIRVADVVPTVVPVAAMAVAVAAGRHVVG